jgi:putative DNA primase/helicase
LVAIAKLAGGDWFERAIRAAVALSGDDRESPSTNQELLQDVADVFAATGGDRIATADLIEALCRDEERPWATYNRGKVISARQVARRLSEFGIVPSTIRLPVGTQKGYKLEAFKDPFARYLGKTAALSDTTPQPSTNAGCDGIDIRNIESVTNLSVTPEAAPDRACDGVTDKKPNSSDGSAEDDGLEVFEV